MFYLVPTSILFISKKEIVIKTILTSFFLGLPASIIIDYILTNNNAWYVETIFSNRLFGILPYEDIIWGIALFLYTIAFYEFFLDTQEENETIEKKGKLFMFFTLFFSPILFVILQNFSSGHILHVLGVPVLLIPIIVFLIIRPHFIKKLFPLWLYFFIHSFVFEVLSLRTGHWEFIGDDYLFWIRIFEVQFPFEEFFYWFVLLQVAIIGYYEFLYDDFK